MTIRFSTGDLSEDLDTLKAKLEKIDEDEIKRRTSKKLALEMQDLVTAAIAQEDDITSPAMNSKYERGKGPSLVQRAAWEVEDKGGYYSVSPHPSVRTRAIVLNSGVAGKITPNGDGPLRFEVNGVPVYAESVDGPDATGYWQAAMRRLKSSGKIKQIARKEFRREIEEAGL